MGGMAAPASGEIVTAKAAAWAWREKSGGGVRRQTDGINGGIDKSVDSGESSESGMKIAKIGVIINMA
jgi:hypothetical protein